MTPPGFGFEVIRRDGRARLGLLHTPHGTVRTPAFVAVGSQATVKSVPPETVAAAGTQLLFANTYHLYLRPGAEVVAQHGGLHRFMNWHGPLLTDSGGFQVFSLGAGLEHGVGKVSNIFPGEQPGFQSRDLGGSMVTVEEGRVLFTSHIDGSRHEFTPERSIDIQRALGADMILAFDECTSPLHDAEYTAASAERTHRWAERSLHRFRETPDRHGYRQALYGVVQGGAFRAIRERSAEVIGAMDFDGIAIGGNLGNTLAEMYEVIDWTTPRLPAARPRHLLGIGDVPSVFEAVERGVDTFDCVSPTRNARNGGALARYDDEGERRPKFRLNLKNAGYTNDLRPIEEGCDCSTCTNFSRAYLRHLLKANEQLGQQAVTVHNLRFMARLMEEIREGIARGELGRVKGEWGGGGY